MPEPQAHPELPHIRRVTRFIFVAAVVITLAKFFAYAISNSVAVLGDALESIINVIAAAMLAYTMRIANRPPDDEHPYGHGKIEFLAIGAEGCMILLAGVVILIEAVRRLFTQDGINKEHTTYSLVAIGIIALMTAALAIYALLAARKYESQNLMAHAKHLLTDVASTVAVFIGVALVTWTEKLWLDPIVAIIISIVILATSWRLLWRSLDGLMDRRCPEDDAVIAGILDDAVASRLIRGYHKVRHRHQGTFHWVDLHLQVDEHLSVRESHELASKIERQIENALGDGNATAHVEPYDADYEARAAAADAAG